MCFVSTKPPKFDCEIFTEAKNARLAKEGGEVVLSDLEKLGYFEDKYLIFVSNLSIMMNIGSLQRHCGLYTVRQP